MLSIWSTLPFFVPLIIALVVVLVNQDEPTTEQLDNWDNGLTTVGPAPTADPFADHPMHCKCYHHR